MKVEKFDVDLTMEDEEDSRPPADEVDAALGNVAQYEGFDPGSDQSLSADGQLLWAAGGDGTLPGNGEGLERGRDRDYAAGTLPGDRGDREGT